MKAHLGFAVLAAVVSAATLRGGNLTEITATRANLPSPPSEITVGTDGNVYIVTQAGNLGKIAPGGTYSEFPLKFGNDQFGIPNAGRLTMGVDGNLWITGFNGHIERATPVGEVTDFTVAPNLVPPLSIVSVREDRALWFFDRQRPGPGVTSTTNKLGRIDIYGGVSAYELGLGTDSLEGLVRGGDGNLWFIDETKNQVMKFSITSKKLAAFAIPSPSNQNDDQTVLGVDGNIWFSRGTSIDRITPAGVITEFHITSGDQPSGIANGGDGNIWFTEYPTGKVGQLVLSSVTSGGSATINESGSVASNASRFYLLPPAFLSPQAGKIVVNISKPCPVVSWFTKVTPPPEGLYFTYTKQESDCADLVLILSSFEDEYALDELAAIDVRNDGPDEAKNVTVLLNTNGPRFPHPAFMIDKGNFDSSSNDGEVITLKAASLGVGSTLRANVFDAAANSCVVFATTPDPDPSNNIGGEIRTSKRVSVTVFPENSTPVAGQPKRGK